VAVVADDKDTADTGGPNGDTLQLALTMFSVR
jgi:hypothetical protein